MSNQRDTDIVLHQREHEEVINAVAQKPVSPGVNYGWRRFFSDDFGARSGVFDGLNFSLSGSDLQIADGNGFAEDPDDNLWPVWVDSYTTINDLFDPPDELLDRRDRVILIVNLSTGEPELFVVTGEPSEEPENTFPDPTAVLPTGTPWVGLGYVTIPADDPDPANWTYEDVRETALPWPRVRRMSIDTISVGDSMAFQANSGTVGTPATAGFFGGYLQKDTRPTIDPTDITGNEDTVLTSVVNMLITLGVVIDGTP